MAKFTKMSIGPIVEVKPLSVSENGTFTAPAGQAYSPVDVSVAPTVEPITITENGIYEVPEPVLEWNTDWKFKEKIPAQAFEEIFATYPEDIFHDISLHIGSTEKWEISISRATNENGYFGNLITLPDNKCVYFLDCADNDTFEERCYICFDGWTEEEFTALNEAIIATDSGLTMAKGWCTRDYEKNTHYASSAPIISTVPESFTGIDLALLSALFELEKIDGYGPVTVAVAPTVEPITITENGVYPVPKGQGVPEFGTDWKFKEKLTLEDIEAVLKYYPLEDNMSHILPNNNWSITFELMDLDETNQTYTVMYDPGTGNTEDLCFSAVGLTPEANEYLLAEGYTSEIGIWESRRGEVNPLIIPNVSADLDINPEHVAPLFDVPGGKALDGWGDITVNVSGGGSANVKPITLITNGTYTASNELKYGSHIKFKDNITAEDFEAYFAKATPRTNHWGDPFYPIAEDWEAQRIDEGEQKVYMIRPANSICPTYGINLSYWMGGMEIADGWVNLNDEHPVNCGAPLAYLPEGIELSADLETTGIFFEKVDGYAPVTVDSKELAGLIDSSWIGGRDGEMSLYCEGARAVGAYTFMHKQAFYRIELPNALSVDEWAFASSYSGIVKLLKVESFYGEGIFDGAETTTLILRDVLSIPANLFKGAFSFEALVLHSPNVVPLDDVNAFYNNRSGNGISDKVYIYVPAALVDSYKTATNWSTYADRIRAIEDYPEVCEV